jgi:hypothetical protein
MADGESSTNSPPDKTPDPETDPYAVLGVDPEASQQDITRAYHHQIADTVSETADATEQQNRLKTAFKTIQEPQTPLEDGSTTPAGASQADSTAHPNDPDASVDTPDRSEKDTPAIYSTPSYRSVREYIPQARRDLGQALRHLPQWLWVCLSQRWIYFPLLLAGLTTLLGLPITTNVTGESLRVLIPGLFGMGLISGVFGFHVLVRRTPYTVTDFRPSSPRIPAPTTTLYFILIVAGVGSALIHMLLTRSRMLLLFSNTGQVNPIGVAFQLVILIAVLLWPIVGWYQSQPADRSVAHLDQHKLSFSPGAMPRNIRRSMFHKAKRENIWTFGLVVLVPTIFGIVLFLTALGLSAIDYGAIWTEINTPATEQSVKAKSTVTADGGPFEDTSSGDSTPSDSTTPGSIPWGQIDAQFLVKHTWLSHNITIFSLLSHASIMLLLVTALIIQPLIDWSETTTVHSKLRVHQWSLRLFLLGGLTIFLSTIAPGPIADLPVTFWTLGSWLCFSIALVHLYRRTTDS